MKPFVTPDTLKFTNHHLPITKSFHFKPSILVFFAASPQKVIDGKISEEFRLCFLLETKPLSFQYKLSTLNIKY